MELAPVIFTPGIHFIVIFAGFIAPVQKPPEYRYERIGLTKHIHSDSRQLLTGLIHFCRIFGQDIFFETADFLCLFIEFDRTYFDDFSRADFSYLPPLLADGIHFKIHEY